MKGWLVIAAALIILIIIKKKKASKYQTVVGCIGHVALRAIKNDLFQKNKRTPVTKGKLR